MLLSLTLLRASCMPMTSWDSTPRTRSEGPMPFTVLPAWPCVIEQCVSSMMQEHRACAGQQDSGNPGQPDAGCKQWLCCLVSHHTALHTALHEYGCYMQIQALKVLREQQGYVGT